MEPVQGCHSCPEPGCNKVFRRRYHLSRHLETYHEQSRQFNCSFCGRSFARKDALFRHGRLHRHPVGGPLPRRKRSQVACLRCHAHKARCDGNVPCRPCFQAHSECIRPLSVPHVPSGQPSLDRDQRAQAHEQVILNNPSAPEEPASPLAPDPAHGAPSASASTAPETWKSLDILTSRPTKSRTPLVNVDKAAHIIWEDTPLAQLVSRSTTQHTEREMAVDCEQTINPHLARSGTSPTNTELDPKGQPECFYEGAWPYTGSVQMSPTAILDDSWQDRHLSEPPFPTQTLPQQNIHESSVEASTEEDNFSPPESLPIRSISEEAWVPTFILDKKAACAVLQISSLDLYFDHFHERWPLLHRPSFSPATTPPDLLCSMALLVFIIKSQSPVSTDITALHRSRWAALMTTLALPENSKFSVPKTALYQECVLNILAGLYIGDYSILENAYTMLSHIICALRLSGVLCFANTFAHETPTTSERQTWIARGYIIHLVFAAFRLGTHLSCILNQPPLLRFEEIDLPFPPTNAAWNASNKDWKRILDNEPQHRTRGAFNHLTVLALSRLTPADRLKLPGYHTPQDFELGLCTMQSRLWEETHCRRISDKLGLGQVHLDDEEPGDAPAPGRGGFGQSWPVLLGIWRITMEQFRRLPSRYSNGEAEAEAYFTGITLYHASLLRAHSDFSLIRRLAFALCEGSTPSNYLRDWELFIQAWTRSPGSRESVWHAAQIVRCFADQVQDSGHEPERMASGGCVVACVASDCLFRAGLVIWACARATMACDMCSPTAAMPEDLLQPHCPDDTQGDVELTCLDQASSRYENWLAGSGRSCIKGVLVCACKMPTLLQNCCGLLQATTRNPELFKRYSDILGTLMHRR